MSFCGNHGRGKWQPNSIASWFLLAYHPSERKIFARTIAKMIAETAPFQSTCPIAPNPNIGNSVKKGAFYFYFFEPINVLLSTYCSIASLNSVARFARTFVWNCDSLKSTLSSLGISLRSIASIGSLEISLRSIAIKFRSAQVDARFAQLL